MLKKAVRIENRQYLDFVKSLPCCIGIGAECWGEVDPSHVLTRGSRHGHDLPGFVFSKCRFHHSQFERDRLRFLHNYPQFAATLKLWGWVWGVDSPNGKLWHPLLSAGQLKIEAWAQMWGEVL
jgi:hypothetical protein